MNPSTTEEIKGTVHEVKGTIKETAGKVTNNPNLQAEGNAEKNTGKVAFPPRPRPAPRQSSPIC